MPNRRGCSVAHFLLLRNCLGRGADTVFAGCAHACNGIGVRCGSRSEFPTCGTRPVEVTNDRTRAARVRPDWEHAVSFRKSLLWRYAVEIRCFAADELRAHV